MFIISAFQIVLHCCCCCSLFCAVLPCFFGLNAICWLARHRLCVCVYAGGSITLIQSQYCHCSGISFSKNHLSHSHLNVPLLNGVFFARIVCIIIMCMFVDACECPEPSPRCEYANSCLFFIECTFEHFFIPTGRFASHTSHFDSASFSMRSHHFTLVRAPLDINSLFSLYNAKVNKALFSMPHHGICPQKITASLK